MSLIFYWKKSFSSSFSPLSSSCSEGLESDEALSSLTEVDCAVLRNPTDLLLQEILPNEDFVTVEFIVRLFVQVDEVVQVFPDVMVLLLVLVEVEPIFFEVLSLQSAN